MVSTGVRSDAAAARVGGGRWWLRLLIPGALLLLAPPAAIAATNRDPDPLFTHEWWTPIAQAPGVSLVLGSVGLALLLSTGVVALAFRLLRTPRRVRPVARLLAALALTVLMALGWSAVAARQAHVTGAAITALLDSGGSAPNASPQAVKTIELALAWPSSPSQSRIVRATSVPAGPWIVQSTEVLNLGAQDEGEDVTMGTLVDPITGRILAAWFWGL